MSSPLCRLFSRSLSTMSKSPQPKTTLKSISDDLYKERSIKVLVEKFKKSSECYRFRTKTGIYIDTVRRLASAKRFRYIEEILEDQKKYSDISKEGFAVRLISLYGKSGMFEHASKVFDEMPERKCERTVKSFNALLGACVSSKKFEKVDGFFRELPDKLSVKPDLVSYNTVIKAFCEMGSLDSAVSMVEEMDKSRVEPDVITFNTLLDALYGNNRFLDGEKIWASMQEKNIIPNNRTYNAKLAGLVSEKKISEGTELVQELESKGLKPDVFTYNALIQGYCNEGDKEGAKRWYSELMKSDCVPDRSTYSTLIPFTCEKSDFDWAFELCNEIFINKCRFDEALMQPVVDGLIKESKIVKAKKLVEMGKSNNYRRCNLKIASEN